jgi:hypothetical protein
LEGRLLRISPAWTSWVFWLLIATFAGAALFLFFAQIDHVESGPAVVRRAPSSSMSADLEIVALLPGNARPRLARGQTMSLRFEGLASPALDLPISDIAPEIVGAERARTLLGEDVSGILEIPGPVVFVRTSVSPATASSLQLVPGVAAVAQVHVGRRRLFEELLPAATP